jgi:hypothetical protein
MIPNHHFQSKDSSSKYAVDTGAVLLFQSMINEKVVAFKAFLTSFTQNFQSSWNQEKVYGRIDPVATFDNTTRTINVAWDIPAYDAEDAKNNLHKCAVLVQMLYPSYTGTIEGGSVTQGNQRSTNSNTIQKTPLIKLKYANLITNFSKNGSNEGLLGYITTVSWNPSLEAGMFVDNNGGSQLYPKLIQLSCDFNVLHQDNIVLDGIVENPNFPFGTSLTEGRTSDAADPNIITSPTRVDFK